MSSDMDGKVSGGKIIDGLTCALEHATVQRHVHEWIRDDLGTAAKMTITPTQVAALVDRICGTKTTIR